MKIALVGIALISYPFIVYFGLPFVEPGILAIVLGGLFLIRHIVQTGHAKSKQSAIPHSSILLFTVLSLLSYSTLANSELALKFYPVVVNLSFLGIFFYSLIKPPSVIEMIARLHEKLDTKGIAYTRNVTMVWCLFFLLNAAVASWTVFHPSKEVWVLYNGLISYLLMGSLFIGEVIYRKLVRSEQSSNSSSLSTEADDETESHD